jgi:hypothetical protein
MYITSLIVHFKVNAVTRQIDIRISLIAVSTDRLIGRDIKNYREDVMQPVRPTSLIKPRDRIAGFVVKSR